MKKKSRRLKKKNRLSFFRLNMNSKIKKCKRSRWRKIIAASATVGACGLYVTLSRHEFDIGSLSLVRLSRAVLTAFKIGGCYKYKLYSSKLDPNSQEYARLRSAVHYEAANMLLDLCCANKGVYIKVGQHVGTLDYLVPHEYIEVLKVLHANAPKSSIQSVFKVLREDLKQEPTDIFECFESEPVGTASLAQVHKAILRKDGTTVAVKVQHSVVLKNSITDMVAMELLVKIMGYVFEDFKFQWLVDETKLMLPKELNFNIEADNAEKVQKLFSQFQWLKIPKVHRDLTTSRVLTMDYVDGAQVTDVKYIHDKKINPVDIASKLGELYAHMIFKSGFVHGDPHPGNIMINVNKDDALDIILLDHGLYANLSEEFRWNYSKLWLSILNKDNTGMKTYCGNLGIKELYPLLVCMVTGRTWESVNKGIDKVKYSKEEQEEFRNRMPEFLTRIGEVLSTVNREMLLILKANDLLRGIEFSLNIDKRQTSFLVMTKCCVDNIFEERMRLCQNTVKCMYISLCRRWTLFKLNLYYAYINIKSKLCL